MAGSWADSSGGSPIQPDSQVRSETKGICREFEKVATCVKTSVRALELDISKSFPMFMAMVPYKNAERELNSVIPVLPAGVARGRFWVAAVLGMAVPVPGARILPGTDRGTPRKGEGAPISKVQVSPLTRPE